MKIPYLLISLLVVSPLSFAKELPSLSEMINRLNQEGFTSADKWKTIGEAQSQAVNSGTLFVHKNSVSSMMAVQGDSETAVMLSFSLASLHCANTSLAAIDMSQNETLKQNMMKSSVDALGTNDKKSVTMAWGYKYETTLTPTKQGIIFSCTLH